MPPPAECIGDTLRTYEAAGTCEAGDCRYPSVDTACPAGCAADPDAHCEEPTREWVALAGSNDHACAVRRTGEVYCWGANQVSWATEAISTA